MLGKTKKDPESSYLLKKSAYYGLVGQSSCFQFDHLIIRLPLKIKNISFLTFEISSHGYVIIQCYGLSVKTNASGCFSKLAQFTRTSEFNV